MSNKQPAPRRGLGRGLGSLIPTGPPEQPSARRDEMDRAASPGESLARYQGSHAAPISSATPPGGAPLTGLSSDIAEAPAATLVEERPADVSGAYFAELPTASITANARQPRQAF